MSAWISATIVYHIRPVQCTPSIYFPSTIRNLVESRGSQPKSLSPFVPSFQQICLCFSKVSCLLSFLLILSSNPFFLYFLLIISPCLSSCPFFLYVLLILSPWPSSYHFFLYFLLILSSFTFFLSFLLVFLLILSSCLCSYPFFFYFLLVFVLILSPCPFFLSFFSMKNNSFKLQCMHVLLHSK